MIRFLIWLIFLIPLTMLPLILAKTYEWKFGMDLNTFVITFGLIGILVIFGFLLLFSFGERRTYVLLDGGILVIHAWSLGMYGSSSLRRVSILLSDIEHIKKVKKIMYLHLFRKEFRKSDWFISSKFCYDQLLITLKKGYTVLPLFEREDFPLSYKNAGMKPKSANSYLFRDRFTVPRYIFDEIMKTQYEKKEE